jgi:hypothetical protein
MTQKTNTISKWLLIVTGLFALLAFTVSATLVFSPQSALDTVDLNARGVPYLTQMWAARQFALGCIFAFSAIKKSKTMISLSFIFFFVMNVGDAIIGFTQNDNGLTIGALVMCLIAATILFFTNKQTK